MKASNTRAITGLYSASYKTTFNGNVRHALAIGGTVAGKIELLLSLVPRLNGLKYPTVRELRGIMEGRSIVAAAQWTAVDGTAFDAIGFAINSANTALDEGGNVAVEIANHRQNVIDTLQENDRTHLQEKALAAFDARTAFAIELPEGVTIRRDSSAGNSGVLVDVEEVSDNGAVIGHVFAAINGEHVDYKAQGLGGQLVAWSSDVKGAAHALVAHSREQAGRDAQMAEHKNERFNIVQASDYINDPRFRVIDGQRGPGGIAAPGAKFASDPMSRTEAIQLADHMERVAAQQALPADVLAEDDSDDVGHGNDCAKRMHGMAECTCGFNEESDDEENAAPQMVELARMMHAMAATLFDTEVPADIMHRLTALADDMEQVAGVSLDKAKPAAAAAPVVPRAVVDISGGGLHRVYAAGPVELLFISHDKDDVRGYTSWCGHYPMPVSMAGVAVALWRGPAGAQNQEEDAHVVAHYFEQAKKAGV